MDTDLFLDGKEIIRKIEAANEEAYFVGGCVRDLLLNREIKDIDIATSASPKKIQTIFKKVIPVGIEHGTVIVRYNHQSYEVTTFRIDGEYTNNRHPDHVEFTSKIDEDLKRRDFTINALAMNKNGDIIDLFAGQKDIQAKRIRTVGNGYDRFSEDSLRMLRAIRFSSQLGFFIEEETLESIISLKKNIESVSIERITSEITKLFAGDFIHRGIQYLHETKIYNHLPILSECPQIIHKLLYLKQPLKSFAEVITLFHYLEPNISISRWTKEWKCSNRIEREAIQLSDALQYFKIHGLDQWLVYQLSSNYYNGFLRLTKHIFPEQSIDLFKLKQFENELPIQSSHQLAIKGTDIINIYPHIKKGPWIRNMILKIEKLVVLNRIKNDSDILKEWIKCNPPEIN